MSIMTTRLVRMCKRKPITFCSYHLLNYTRNFRILNSFMVNDKTKIRDYMSEEVNRKIVWNCFFLLKYKRCFSCLK